MGTAEYCHPERSEGSGPLRFETASPEAVPSRSDPDPSSLRSSGGQAYFAASPTTPVGTLNEPLALRLPFDCDTPKMEIVCEPLLRP